MLLLGFRTFDEPVSLLCIEAGALVQTIPDIFAHIPSHFTNRTF